MSRIGLQSLPMQRRIDGHCESVHDEVAEEAPVALIYNDQPFAVMLASPTDLEDFALGFALGEGVIDRADEFELVERQHTAEGIALHGSIPPARFEALQQRRRTLTAGSGCGLCGRETLQAAIPPVPPVNSGFQLSTEQIRAAVNDLPQWQVMNRLCGGVHAAAHVSAEGMRLREDIGRHNAVDKLIGALARDPATDGFLLVTSRASYEIVHKAARAGLAAVVALSAPTAMAIELAEHAGVCLVAFARGNSMNVYSHPERLQD